MRKLRIFFIINKGVTFQHLPRGKPCGLLVVAPEKIQDGAHIYLLQIMIVKVVYLRSE